MAEMTLDKKELNDRNKKMIDLWAFVLTGILAIVLFFLIFFPQ